jgi:mRNA interferase HigB
MKLISNRVLREFAQVHADAETSLQAWRRLIEKGTYRNFAELRAAFAGADKVGDRMVFNIRGNKYRLVAAVLFSVQQVFVKAVLTHADYDKGEWK